MPCDVINVALSLRYSVLVHELNGGVPAFRFESLLEGAAFYHLHFDLAYALTPAVIVMFFCVNLYFTSLCPPCKALQDSHRV